MAAAFESGRLPEPARTPHGGADEQAAALARMVGARDENSTAALYAAVLAAGFGVRERDGGVLQTVEPGQGLMIPSALVAGMAKLYGTGSAYGFGDFSAAFARLFPGLRPEQFAEMVAAGLRENAAGDDPAMRFWARFVVELGRSGEKPYDLSASGPGLKTARLDAVQLNFILLRLSADLFALDPSIRPRPSALNSRRLRGRSLHTAPAFGSAVWQGAARPGVSFLTAGLASPAAQEPKLPCTLSEKEGFILDTFAGLSGIGFGQLFGYLDEVGAAADAAGDAAKAGDLQKYGKYGKATGIANIILNVVKLIWTYAALKIEVGMDGPLLERTQDTSPGKWRTLTAKVRMGVGKWQIVNCIRPALNVAGVDFSLPGDGAVGGAGVSWALTKGGDDRGVLDQLADVPDIIRGELVHGTAVVALRSKRRKTSGGVGTGGDTVVASPRDQETDENGVSTMQVEGVPQSEDLRRRKISAVIKPAGVKVAVTLSRVKDRDSLISAVLSAGGLALTALGGDAAGAAIGLSLEMLNRFPVFSETFDFKVRDWQPCDGGWSGAITYEESHDLSGGQNFDRSEYKMTAEVSSPRVQSFPGGISMLRAEAPAAYTYKQESYTRGFCKDDYSKSAANHSGETAATVYLRTQGEDYQLGVNAGGHRGVQEIEHRASNCPAAKEHQRTEVRKFNREVSFGGADLAFRGRLDPANPDEISGTETRQAGNTRSTFRWVLRRCR
jgi:hypothetical protein